MTLKESFPTRYVDRTIGVDVDLAQLVLARGEQALTRYDGVWDTRAPASMPDSLKRGTFTFTNLRVVWNSEAAPTACNLTVGYATISRIGVGNVSAPTAPEGREPSARSLVERQLVAPGRTVIIHCAEGEHKFKFEFRPPSSAPGAPGAPAAGTTFFDVFQTVYRAYDTTRLYRKLRMRSFLRVDGKLSTLERETVQAVHEKVSLLGSMVSGAAPGVLVLTTHRVVWYSTASESLNLSLPYVDCTGLLLKEQPVGKTRVRMLVLSAPLGEGERDSAAALGSDVKGAGKTSRYQARKQRMVNLAFACPGDEARIAAVAEDVLARIRAGKQNPDYGVVLEVCQDEAATLQGGSNVLGGAEDAREYALGHGGGAREAPAPAVSKPIQAILARMDRVYTYLSGGGSAGGGGGAGGAGSGGTEASAGATSGAAPGTPSGTAWPDIEYSPELGLSFEAPPPGVSVSDLWGW